MPMYFPLWFVLQARSDRFGRQNFVSTIRGPTVSLSSLAFFSNGGVADLTILVNLSVSSQPHPKQQLGAGQSPRMTRKEGINESVFAEPNGPGARIGLRGFELLELEVEHGERGPNRSLIKSSPLS
jgi:hypothetical protein